MLKRLSNSDKNSRRRSSMADYDVIGSRDVIGNVTIHSSCALSYIVSQ